ncbi:MAG: diaminopimelate decarboxylase [Prolixibacteraceae bacterium]|nr:diaminopimelate decarboxylase [Prolixibacteraceae bacterium]
MIEPRFIEQFRKMETPFYFYDMNLLRKTIETAKAESSQYGFEVHYALKANNCDPVIKAMIDAGFGADCVSGNEISKCIAAGFPSSKIAFAGVGKSDREIETALENNIFSFNCESIPEIEVINEIAGRMGKIAPVALRINPDVDPKTHEYITTGLKDNKFGISYRDFDEVGQLMRTLPNIQLKGIHFHIGSQITDISIFETLSLKVNAITSWFDKNGLYLEHINVGGGLGINYTDPKNESIPNFKAYFKAFNDHIKLKPGQQLHFELGRSLVGQCGQFITRVLYVKQGMETQFLIVDGGMTELIRPMLYKAHHQIVSLTSKQAEAKYDVVGPICESTDVFAKGIQVNASQRGDILAIRTAGAYGQVMASAYNMRGPVKEIFSDNL